MRKFFLGFALACLMLFAYLYHDDFRPVIYAAAEKTVSEITASTSADSSEFRLLFCGTGSPNRSPDRGQPCLALIANGKLFLFDAGEGAIGKLSEYGAPTGAIDTIFLTHLHSDHVSGVAEVLHNTWLYGRRHVTNIVGPTGTEKMLKGFRDAYDDDLHERTRVVGPENIDLETAFSGANDLLLQDNEAQVVYSVDGLTIKAFLVDHPDWSQAYGYRIEHRGKVVVISGDTAPSDGIRLHAKNADVLIHEAVNMEIFTRVGELMEAQGGPIPKDRIARIASVHTPTDDLARIAQGASVKNLYITHLIPAVPALWMADRFFTSGMSEIYEGSIVVARDGLWIEVDEL